MKIRILLYGVLVTLGFLSIALSSGDTGVTAQVTGSPCITTIGIIGLTNNSTVDGVQIVKLQGDSNTSSVEFLVDGKILGRGKRDTADLSKWFMKWDTQYSEAGSRSVRAFVHDTSNNVCIVEPVFVNVFNSYTEILQAQLWPPSWSGYTNTSVQFDIQYQQAATTGFVNFSEFAVVKWFVTNTGSISGEPGSIGYFSSGSDEGIGTVKAEVKYGGQILLLESTVEVTSPYVTTTDTSGGGTGSTTTATGDPITTTEDSTGTQTTEQSGATAQLIEPAEVAALLIESDDPVDICVVEKTGEENIQQWIDDNRSPSSGEFENFLGCFSDQKFVIPSVLAPVPPNKVVSTPESTLVKINKPKNENKVIPGSNETKKVLVFSGTTTPNINVLLYVFSEPLVLATTSDDNGVWTYTLEDPLTSGKHEVYALVEKGNGEYERSDLASIFIGTAEASEENPNGYSLELVSEPTITASNRSANLFIASTIGMVTFISVILFSYWVQRLKQPSADMAHGKPVGGENMVHPEDDKFEDIA